MARKKKSGGDEGGGYSYMDTYGDLVTLLLCFFVLLYSFSSVDSAKWQELVMALSSGGASVVMDPLDPGPPRDDTEMENLTPREEAEQDEIDEDFDELYQKIKTYINDNELTTKVEVEKDDIYIKIEFIDDDIFFKSGSADLSDSAGPILDSVGEMILAHEPNVASVEVEGHTDDVPIHTTKYPSNWSLSAWRALNVVDYMLFESSVHTDIDPRKYAPKAMGEYHPVVSNTSDENRARNRRVVFMITERTVSPSEAIGVESDGDSYSDYFLTDENNKSKAFEF